jgi:hypothetical protein
MPPFGSAVESALIYMHPVTLVAFVRFRFYNSLENIKAVDYTFFF